MKLRLAALLLVAVPLSACGSSHLVVEQANRSAVRANAVNLVYDDTTTGVPQKASEYVKRKMEEAFYGNGAPFHRGQDLTVRYHFVGYDAGSRLARWAAGSFGAGEAQMVLEAEFVDPAGTVLSRVRAEGEIGMGVFGGSSNSAIDKAVKEIRDYAITHYRR